MSLRDCVAYITPSQCIPAVGTAPRAQQILETDWRWHRLRKSSAPRDHSCFPGLVVVTETEVFRTTYTNLEQMVRAAEHVLLCSSWLKATVVKSKRNLAEVSFHLEIFPEMNLHMMMKSETDNLTVPRPFDTTVTVWQSGHLSCPLPRPWWNHCLPAGLFLVYTVCHYLRFQSNKRNQQANKAILYNLCNYFCVPGKPSPTL